MVKKPSIHPDHQADIDKLVAEGKTVQYIHVESLTLNITKQVNTGARKAKKRKDSEGEPKA